MNIKNPSFRLIIYSLFAALGTASMIWLGIMDVVKPELLIPFAIVCFLLLLIAQYITSYLMEEFIMELKGKQGSKWISAPLGILFSYLTYSIVSLSLGLLI